MDSGTKYMPICSNLSIGLVLNRSAALQCCMLDMAIASTEPSAASRPRALSNMSRSVIYFGCPVLMRQNKLYTVAHANKPQPMSVRQTKHDRQKHSTSDCAHLPSLSAHQFAGLSQPVQEPQEPRRPQSLPWQPGPSCHT